MYNYIAKFMAEFNEVLLDMLKRFDYPTQNEFETMEVICSV